MDKRCKECGGAIRGKKYPNRMFCGLPCQQAFARRAHRELNPPLESNKGTTGAISELVVSADLMARGFEVYRALSPNSSCDLAVIAQGRLLRVEVRTGFRRKDGSLSCDDHGIYEVLAVVSRDRTEILYRPPLEDVGAMVVKPRRFTTAPPIPRDQQLESRAPATRMQKQEES